MANPNLLNITSVIGVTTAVGLTTATNAFLSNPDASGKILKVNSITAANIDGSVSADITVKYHLSEAGVGSSIALANTITIPADASLVVTNKDNFIYLEENRSLTAQASAEDSITIICSYDEIS